MRLPRLPPPRNGAAGASPLRPRKRNLPADPREIARSPTRRRQPPPHRLRRRPLRNVAGGGSSEAFRLPPATTGHRAAPQTASAPRLPRRRPRLPFPRPRLPSADVPLRRPGSRRQLRRRPKKRSRKRTRRKTRSPIRTRTKRTEELTPPGPFRHTGGGLPSPGKSPKRQAPAPVSSGQVWCRCFSPAWGKRQTPSRRHT